jgi:hypothetical protein
MKRSLALAVAMIFASGTALAFHCPKDMKEIDDALAKKPQLSEAKMKEITMLRADGEALHKAGKHQESVDKLARAKALLGLKTDAK